MFETIEREIEGAIKGHLSWKHQLDEALESKGSPVSVEAARCDRRCDFGSWIYKESLPEHIRMEIESFDIKSLHRAFHNCAANLLEFALDLKSQGDAEYVLLLSAYEQASSALVRALLEWKDMEVRALLSRKAAVLQSDIPKNRN